MKALSELLSSTNELSSFARLLCWRIKKSWADTVNVISTRSANVHRQTASADLEEYNYGK